MKASHGQAARAAATGRRGANQRTPAARHAPAARRTPFVLLILGLLVGGMGLLLALNTASAANEVARHDLASGDQSAAARLVELENQVQDSAAPANLAAAAAALGMVPAGNPGFLEIGATGRVRVLGRAAPASAVPVVIWHPAATTTAPAGKHAKKKTTKPANNKKSHEHARPGTRTTRAQGSAKHRTTNGTAGHHHRRTPAAANSTPTRTPTPSPTPTPTPETTLPGGNR